MILIIGVRFRKSSKVYYFDPTGYEIKKGDHVIVETARGIEYGTVVLGPKEVTDDRVVSPLKPLTRTATPEDEKTNIENEQKEKEAYRICLEKIKKHDLKMKLIDSEYTFDRNKLLFYFTADGRIDFRELVKDLASVFRTRIELRQIGVRDETKLLGGMAICGRPLCCHTFLSEFAPVSIKMAKEQGLSLNPTQISGVCGRLMCCLKNEQEAYEELNSNLPAVKSQVKTIDGYIGEVQSTSVLKQLVKVVITKKNGEREIREYPVTDLSFKDHQISSEGSELEASLNEMVDEQGLDKVRVAVQRPAAGMGDESHATVGKAFLRVLPHSVKQRVNLAGPALYLALQRDKLQKRLHQPLQPSALAFYMCKGVVPFFLRHVGPAQHAGVQQQRRERRLEFMGHAADEKPLPLGGFHKLRYARFNGLRHQVEIPRKRAYLVSRMHIRPHGIIAARNLPRRFCKGGQRPCAPVHYERNAARADKYARKADGGKCPR